MKLRFDHLHYIAIEGVIGVGKTSLAHLLQQKLGGQIVLEEFEENPFLEDFYRDPEHFAFQTQIFFLLSRYRQQENIMQYDLFEKRIISDYMFVKDRIFATLNLNEKEMTLYDKLARILEKRIVKPDLAIYLKASTKRLMYNIKRRARPYERNIKEDYIEALNRLYEEYFWNYSATPLLIINTENLDFVHNKNHLSQIVTEVSQHRSGKKLVNFDLDRGIL
ncbi:deoxynucleoside kinase [candidate division KSB1 bacterium 4484_188]|nr:MAG: deoxynucleoside kinase [candidate division KSB1 bacterium 4484_188]HFE62990.1 deoxynucleoside kinase [Caldithrix sp.]